MFCSVYLTIPFANTSLKWITAYKRFIMIYSIPYISIILSLSFSSNETRILFPTNFLFINDRKMNIKTFCDGKWCQEILMACFWCWYGLSHWTIVSVTIRLVSIKQASLGWHQAQTKQTNRHRVQKRISPV